MDGDLRGFVAPLSVALLAFSPDFRLRMKTDLESCCDKPLTQKGPGNSECCSAEFDGSHTLVVTIAGRDFNNSSIYIKD